MPFDPNSNDAVFAKLINRLDNQDTVLAQILAEVKKTNGRVNRLEQNEAVTKGKVAVVSAVISAAVGLAGWLLTHNL